jgi:hypothetical protein
MSRPAAPPTAVELQSETRRLRGMLKMTDDSLLSLKSDLQILESSMKKDTEILEAAMVRMKKDLKAEMEMMKSSILVEVRKEKDTIGGAVSSTGEIRILFSSS